MLGRRISFYIGPKSLTQLFILLMKLCAIVLPVTLLIMAFRDNNFLAAGSLACFVLAVVLYLCDRKFSRSYLFVIFLCCIIAGIISMFICLAKV